MAQCKTALGFRGGLGRFGEKVSEVVDSMRDILSEMGREPPTIDSVVESTPDEESTGNRVKAKLDAADALLRKLNRGESGH